MGQRFFKIKGRSLDEAYARLRKQFGDDAVVLGTHQVREGGLLGLLGRSHVELTAAVPVETVRGAARPTSAAARAYAASDPAPAGAPGPAQYEPLLRAAQARVQGSAPAAGAAAPQAAPMLAFPQRAPEPESPAAMSRELQEIREMVQVLYAEHPGAGLPADFAPHYRTLIERGVTRKIAATLIGAVARNSDPEIIRDPRVFVERLHMELRRAVQVTNGIALTPGRRRIAALCGATGVGKTTSLAKLAAHFAVRERARVALVTADTYRIAASEQLRTYANIVGVPMRVVNDPAEMAAAMAASADCDLVLIDTAGGSQYNLEQINELKGLLAAARPHEVHLTLSAGVQAADLRSVVSNFKCLGPTALLFTKLDETNSYGALLSTLLESGLPLGYLSMGQSVPDDLRAATPGLVANLVLEGRRYTGHDQRP